VEVVVEPVADGAFSFVATKGFCSSWQRCAISLLILVNERSPRVSANLQGTKRCRCKPSLTGSPLITGHMAPPAIQTSMINFSPFRGCRFPLAPTGGGVVVEGFDLDLRNNGWPDGDVGLLQMGAHRRSIMCGAKLRRVRKVGTVCS
jgi:hypothetical protein